MPLPNEHACRLRSPDDFQDDSFRRTERTTDGKKYSVIMGKLEDEETMTEQAYRYDKDTWESGEASTHCKAHDGTFEAAAPAEESVASAVTTQVIAAEGGGNKAFTHNSTVDEDEPDWGNIDKTKLPRTAFADTGESDKVSTWGFPHHYIKGGGSPDDDGRWTTGTMFLHRGGLGAARAAAEGARAGEEAAPAIKSHLATHAKAIGMGEEGRESAEMQYKSTRHNIVSIDREARTVVFAINTDHVDRDNEVLLPRGAQMKNYRENPVIMYGHNYEGLPIAKSRWEKRGKNAQGRDVILSQAEFARTPFANDVFDLVADGFLRTGSVGFIPMKRDGTRESPGFFTPGGGRPPTEKEIEDHPDWAAAKTVYDHWELLEWSIVPVPSNPYALARAVMKGKSRLPKGLTMEMLARNEDSDRTAVTATEWNPAHWEPDAHEATCEPIEMFQADSFCRETREHEGWKYIAVTGITQDIKQPDGSVLTGTTMIHKLYYPVFDWEADKALKHAGDKGATTFWPDHERARIIPSISPKPEPTADIRIVESHEPLKYGDSEEQRLQIIPQIEPNADVTADIRIVEPIAVEKPFIRIITTDAEIRDIEKKRACGAVIL